jgi:putative addiction module component (TIGR02574 family)
VTPEFEMARVAAGESEEPLLPRHPSPWPPRRVRGGAARRSRSTLGSVAAAAHAADLRRPWARRSEPRYNERIMSAAAKQIIEDALKLDPTERAHVAHELLESIAVDTNGGLDAEWLKELEQRARDIEEGRTDFVSWPDARREIESSLRRSR